MSLRAFSRRLVLFVVSLVAWVLLLEGGLALSGFDLPDTGYFRRDARLGYTLASGRYPGGVRIDADGFRGPDLLPRRPGRIRIVTLGDSCTFGVGVADESKTYPRVLERLLRRRGLDVEVVNAGVPGYTSFQGTLLIPTLERLRADAVTVYYGWNDHWLAGFLTDRTLASHPLLLRLHILLSKSRLYYALRRLLQPGRPRTDQASVASLGVWDAWLRRKGHYRVPLDEYEANLGTIVAWGRRENVRVVLITAPEGIDREGRADAVYRAQGLIAEGDSLAPLHASYNDRVHRLARRTGTRLVDAHRILRARGNGFFLDPVVDPVHPDAEGHALIAEALAEALADLRPRESPEARRAARVEDVIRRGIDWYLTGAETLVCRDKAIPGSDPKYFWFLWRVADLSRDFALKRFVRRAVEACGHVDSTFYFYHRLLPPGVLTSDFRFGAQVARGIHEQAMRWAVNCDRWILDDETRARLFGQRYLFDHVWNRPNRKSYALTHLLVALHWLRLTEPGRGRCVEPTLLENRIHELASSLAWEHYTGLDNLGGYEGTRRRDAAGRAHYAMRDITGQRLGIILESGHPEFVRRAWLDHLTDSQNPDGGWSARAEGPSSRHTTMCALWALAVARYVYPEEFGYAERQARAESQ